MTKVFLLIFYLSHIFFGTMVMSYEVCYELATRICTLVRMYSLGNSSDRLTMNSNCHA